MNYIEFSLGYISLACNIPLKITAFQACGMKIVCLFVYLCFATPIYQLKITPNLAKTFISRTFLHISSHKSKTT